VLNDLKHHESEYNVLAVYGGVDMYTQTTQLRKGVDFLVGTTGRVMDHMNRGNLNFCGVQAFILDEADTMLNMGFKEDVDALLKIMKENCRETP